ncbi:unnamed protein product [Sympodiomycopsis kandeliae]
MSVAQNSAPPLANGHHNEESGVGGTYHAAHEQNGTLRRSPSATNDKYSGGQAMTQTVTPGGHTINDELLAIGSAPRKIANPLPMGVLAFGTTTMLLSLYNVGVRGLSEPNAVLSFALFYGGLTQYLAGLWEGATGNTFGFTVFTAFGCFWWGFAAYLVPFFGESGMYNDQPGVYSATGVAAMEGESALGLFLFIWGGITLVLLLGAARSSITLILLLFLLFITFMLLGAFYYTGNMKLEIAGGAFGIATALVAYWLAAGSFLTRQTSFFTLPLGDVSIKD